MLVYSALAESSSGLARPTAGPHGYPAVLALAASSVIGVGIAVIFLAMLGGGIVLGIRLMRARPVTSPGAIKAVLGWPALASINPLQPGFARSAMMAGDDGTLRRLQLALGSERPLRSILVTSASPGRASSTVAGDLAYFVSAQGLRTLLVDVQLARPSQDQRFGVAAGPGLTDLARTVAMEGRAAVDLPQFMFAPTEVDAPTLRVMPVGMPPPDVTAALASRSLGRTVELLVASGPDVVILDAPPFTTKTGAAALASYVDGVVVVVEQGRTRRGDLARLRCVLLHAQARVLGCIIAEQPAPESPRPARGNGRSRGVSRRAYAGTRR